MRTIILILSLIVLCSCSSIKPTFQEETFLALIHECFAEPDYILLRKTRAVDFLHGDTDYASSWFLYHNKDYVLDAEKAWVSNFDEIIVPIERMECEQNKFCFKVGKDRLFIRPWLSSCEFMRENFLSIQDIKIGQ